MLFMGVDSGGALHNGTENEENPIDKDEINKDVTRYQGHKE